MLERDSLLDLAVIDDDKDRFQSGSIIVIDNDSDTIPGRYPASCRPSQIIVEDSPNGEKKPDGKGVPNEQMPIGQEETTQQFVSVDAAELFALELPDLFDDKIGDKVTKLMG
jgi:hypothetical protein